MVTVVVDSMPSGNASTMPGEVPQSLAETFLQMVVSASLDMAMATPATVLANPDLSISGYFPGRRGRFVPPGQGYGPGHGRPDAGRLDPDAADGYRDPSPRVPDRRFFNSGLRPLRGFAGEEEEE